MTEFLQSPLSGQTVGAVYALAALGFTIIYDASDVVNFAQGEFVMLGGMITVFASRAGLPLALAAPFAIVVTAAVGVALYKCAIAPARGASLVTLVIITIGASIFLRGAAQIVFDKQLHRFASFTGNDPIQIGGATILPQSLFVFPSPFYYRVGALVFINGLAVIGLVVLIAFAGQISLGHAGFFGIGAYSCALLPPHLRGRFERG